MTKIDWIFACVFVLLTVGSLSAWRSNDANAKVSAECQQFIQQLEHSGNLGGSEVIGCEKRVAR